MISIENHSDDILHYIYADYIFNQDLSSVENVTRNLGLLVSNKLASVIKGYSMRNHLTPDIFNIVSKFMIKHNKKLKKFNDASSFQSNIYSDMSAEKTKLLKYFLDIGVHTADLGDGNYSVLRVLEDEEYQYITFELYFIGPDNRKLKSKILEKKNKIIESENDNELNYLYSTDTNTGKTTKFKSFDKLIMRDKSKYLSFIDNWVNNIPLYYQKGIPCKLSILLYGKPGTGKTTFYKALANYLNIKSVFCITQKYFYNGDWSGNNDYKPLKRRSNHSSNTSSELIAIDDIDCICKSREIDTDRKNQMILSSLLEFLDNPREFYFKAKDGVHYPVSIVVATTNYYDKLDEAVKRYGRFDLQIEMEYFNKNEAEEMCQLYDLDLEDIIEDSNKPDFSISPAQLQALCIQNIDKRLKQMEEN